MLISEAYFSETVFHKNVFHYLPLTEIKIRVYLEKWRKVEPSIVNGRFKDLYKE